MTTIASYYYKLQQLILKNVNSHSVIPLLHLQWLSRKLGDKNVNGNVQSISACEAIPYYVNIC